MKKVSSNPHLSELGKSAPLASTPKARSDGLLKLAQQHGFGGPRPKMGGSAGSLSIPKSSSEESMRTKAWLSDHYQLSYTDVTSPMGSEGAEIAYAIVSKGLAATECMATIEMEEAPVLVDGVEGRETDIAACMATPVLPDTGNGEMILEKTAKIDSEIRTEIAQRYAKEVVSGSSRRLSRKRSWDGGEGMSGEDGMDGGEIDDQLVRLPSVPRLTDASELPPEGEKLLAEQIHACQAKHTLDLEDEEGEDGVFHDNDTSGRRQQGETFYTSTREFIFEEEDDMFGQEQDVAHTEEGVFVSCEEQEEILLEERQQEQNLMIKNTNESGGSSPSGSRQQQDQHQQEDAEQQKDDQQQEDMDVSPAQEPKHRHSGKSNVIPFRIQKKHAM